MPGVETQGPRDEGCPTGPTRRLLQRQLVRRRAGVWGDSRGLSPGRVVGRGAPDRATPWGSPAASPSLPAPLEAEVRRTPGRVGPRVTTMGDCRHSAGPR